MSLLLPEEIEPSLTQRTFPFVGYPDLLDLINEGCRITDRLMDGDPE